MNKKIPRLNKRNLTGQSALNQRKYQRLFSVTVFALFVFLMLGFGGSVMAADYYVSPTTTSTNWAAAQNIDTPCTPQTAMANAVAGDTVYFRGGTYDPGDALDYTHPAMYPDNSGIEGNPITLKAYPNEIVILIGNSYGPTFGANNRDWIVWDGFTTSVVAFVPQGVQRAVTFVDSDHCTIRNCDITGLTITWHANNMCIGSYDTNYLTIENNKLHDSFRSDVEETNSCAIMMYNTINATIRNNDIYGCVSGIFSKVDNAASSFYKNHIWDCYVGIIVAAGGIFRDQEVYQNIIRNCRGEGIWENPPLSEDVQIFNNVIYNSGISGTTRGINFLQGSRNAIIYNNIVDGYLYAVRYCSGVAEVSYSDYNDFHDVSYWNMDSYEGTDYLSLGEWTAATGLDVNSITSDPQFVNAGGANPEDYKLQSGSPCLTSGRGGSYTSVQGAYITGDEIIGYTDSGAPDTTPPSRSNPQPTGTLSSGTTSTTISLDTDETAICKYSTNSGTNYDLMTLQLSSGQANTHTATVSNLEDGNSYTYYIRCQDESNNQNPDDFEISFNIASSTTYSISNFINLVTDWLKTESGLESDVNGDGVVNTRDLGIMMSNWQN